MAEHVAVLMDGWSLDREARLRADMAVFRDEAENAKGGSVHICPAQILPKIYQQIEECALTAHQAIGCRGEGRSDFRYDDESDAFVRWEADLQPGTTETRLMPGLAAHAGLNFGELVGWIVADASLDR